MRGKDERNRSTEAPVKSVSFVVIRGSPGANQVHPQPHTAKPCGSCPRSKDTVNQHLRKSENETGKETRRYIPDTSNQRRDRSCSSVAGNPTYNAQGSHNIGRYCRLFRTYKCSYVGGIDFLTMVNDVCKQQYSHGTTKDVINIVATPS